MSIKVMRLKDEIHLKYTQLLLEEGTVAHVDPKTGYGKQLFEV